jgi:hypothetical protein
MHNAGSAPVGVGSFPELNLAVGYGASSDEITAPDIVVDHQLEVRRTRTTDMLIASTIGATLSGGNQTRLLFLQKGSALCLCGINLVGGVASGDCSKCPSTAAPFS